MAVIRLPVRRGATRDRTVAPSRTSISPDERDAPAQVSSDSHITVNIIWLSICTGAAISVGFGAAATVARAGMADGVSEYLAGAVAFLISWAVIAITCVTLFSGRS
jgi:hypothetical protein